MAAVIPNAKQLTSGNLDPLLDDIGKELVEECKDILRLYDKDWSGAAIRSIQYDKAQHVVFSDLLYVYNIEFGRKKGHPPPHDKIRLWVETKLGIHPPDSDIVAGKIVNSIARDGIPQTRFMQKALFAVTGQATPIVKKRRKLTRSEKFLKQFKKITKKINRKIKKTRRVTQKAGRELKFLRKVAKKNKGGFKAFK